MSCVGGLVVRRRYWQCRCGADGGYPADEILGLSGRLTRALQKHACRLSADGSFAAAAEHLREMLGVRVCPETLRGLSERHGRAMARFQPADAAGAQSFRAAPGQVELTIDAGKVNTRDQGWKDLKIGVFQKRPSGEPVSPDGWDGQRLPAATARVAFAAVAPAKRFRRCWRGWSKRLGVAQAGELHVLADGAAWIWKSVERVLSGCGQTLDVYHACEHLSRASDGLYGPDTAASRSAFGRGRSLLVAAGWAGVCTWVGEQLAAEDTPARRAVLDRVIGYFAPHIGRLDYAGRLAAGRAIGSGAVEGQAKTLGLRLKARGARWRLANVRPMASLVCVRHSDQWHTYWTAA